MSTAIRILVLVGSITVYIFSYFMIIKIEICNGIVKKVIRILFVVYGGLGLFAFLFINPDKEIFLSINRVKMFSAFFIILGLGLLFIFYLIYLDGVTAKLKVWFNFAMIIVALATSFVVVSKLPKDMSERYIEKVNQTESYERIEPYTTQELKTIILEYDEEGKVTLCKYEYVDGASIIQSEISGKDIENVVYIKNGDSYIELTKISTDYINKEMNPEAKGYSFTETEEKYILYLNESQTTVKY